LAAHKGQGTIYERNGRYCGQITIPGAGRRTFYGKTSREVQHQELYTELGKRLQPKSIRQTHATLNQALKLAVEWNMIPVNPAEKVKLPKIQTLEKTILTPEQVGLLLTATEQHRLHALRDECQTNVSTGPIETPDSESLAVSRRGIGDDNRWQCRSTTRDSPIQRVMAQASQRLGSVVRSQMRDRPVPEELSVRSSAS
jgi:hypothetical protein